MHATLRQVRLEVSGDRIRATFASPGAALPAALFVHGWNGNRRRALGHLRDAAALGCAGLAFDLRGHEDTADQHGTVNRQQNLDDLVAAYDWLAARAGVDPAAIAVVGFSYGAYLAALLAQRRPVRWLALRSPALYPDEDWCAPKRSIKREHDLRAFRERALSPAENRALRACAGFRGDVLLVESECDEVLPRQVARNYLAAFAAARSLTARVLAGADHELGTPRHRRAYAELLARWLDERLREARLGGLRRTRPSSG